MIQNVGSGAYRGVIAGFRLSFAALEPLESPKRT